MAISDGSKDCFVTTFVKHLLYIHGSNRLHPNVPATEIISA